MINLLRRNKKQSKLCYVLFLFFALIGCESQVKSDKKKLANPFKPKPENIKNVTVVNDPQFPPSPPYVAPLDIAIYAVTQYQKNNKESIVFISVSEIYPLSEHPDSVAIPNLGGKGIKDIEYFTLEAIYKERFFHRTKIAKADKIFIYDYAADNLLVLPIKALKVIACLSPYANLEDESLSQSDYMIGFEIDKKFLNGFKDLYFQYTLAYIGKEGPFDKGQMKAMTWEKIDSKSFPKIKSEDVTRLRGAIVGDAYKFETDTLHYFIQDFLGNEMNSARHLVIFSSKTKDLVFEKIYFEEDGIELAPLNFSKAAYNNIYQWTGNLFKAKPPVIFGFTSLSFGCESISFLHKVEKDIYIKCDNRH